MNKNNSNRQKRPFYTSSITSSFVVIFSILLLLSSFYAVHTALAIPNQFQNNNASITSTVKPINHSPVANGGPNQTVYENTTVAIVGAGIDSDLADKLSYLWRQTNGPAVELSNRKSANPTFTSPIVSSDTDLMFSLIVTDDKGAASNPATVTVTVKHINQKPVANAGTSQTVHVGYAVTLDGTASKDPDGEPLSYSWTQINGPSVKLDDNNTAMATFTAPSNVTANTDLTFKLIVKDNKNVTSTDSAKVTVKYEPPSNKPPTANAGADQTINAGDTVTLDGSKSTDPDGNIISYSWRQTEGPSVVLNGADTVTASFTALSVIAETGLKFSLIVTDDKGAVSDPASVTTIVKAAEPPAKEPTTRESLTNVTSKQVTTSGAANEHVFVRKWGSEGTGDGQFKGPAALAVDSGGNVYVADYTNGRIQKFDSNGKFLLKWGSGGYAEGPLFQPVSVALDSSGNVYVAQLRPDYYQIQKFDSNGKFIKWGGTDITGNRSKFTNAEDIAIDSSNNFYIADTTNDIIHKFDSNGNFITEWRTNVTGDDPGSYATGLAFDPSGNVYIANTDHVKKFDSNGKFLLKWGSEGIGNGEFFHPTGIAIDSFRDVYVADTGNNRIQVFAGTNNTSK